MLSTCAVHLTTPHRALGTLELASRRGKAYSDDYVDLLAIVADAVAVTLDNALSHEQLREEHDRLTLLLELTNSLVSNLELRDVLTAVMRSARRIMRSDSAVVALPGADEVGRGAGRGRGEISVVAGSFKKKKKKKGGLTLHHED